MQSLQERGQFQLSRAERLRVRRLGTSWDRYDTVLVGIGVIVAIVVHPVHAMLRHPYWLDEAWVAVLTRAPFSRLTDLSASAPAGFVALLKLVPGTGLQRARIVPLGFAVLSAVMAYVLARTLSWERRADARFGAVVAGLVVMLAPLSLGRNDLKQYTCDAFCALSLLTVAAWAERAPHRSRLVWLAVVAILVIPFSSTSAFVSVAVFAGLLGSALVARNVRRAVDVMVAGAVAVIGFGTYLAIVVTPNLNPKLKAYWASQYLSGSPLRVFTATWNRLARLTTELSMPLPMFIVLFVVGIAVLVKLRARALAIALPFLWIEMAAMGRLHKYPYLDLRTSHFLFVVSLVVVAIGAVGLLQWIARARGVFRGDAGPALAIVVGGAIAVLFMLAFVREVDQLHIPNENIRAPTFAISARLTPRDVVLVNFSGSFGFSYYWPHGSIAFRPDTSGQGFRPVVEQVPAIYARDRSYRSILAALHRATDEWEANGSGSRLFIVRTHLDRFEAEAWRQAFRELDLHPHREAVGSDPLLVVSRH